ncbi:MAG: hypothetical protein IPI60_09325 [Saprospiraceae bacterium]|nr:hypothetical protein [Saprospiraceae bacterium]
MNETVRDIGEVFMEFVKEFVAKDRQHRILSFFDNKKNWRKIENEFHTSNPFDTQKLLEIESRHHNANSIYLLMEKLGTHEHCYSLLDYLNNKPYHCDLKEKLSDTVGYNIETIIFCPTTKTGYYEGGHAKDRYILKA